MLSNCYAALGQARRALGYLDLVEAHEPDTALQLLLRLRLVMELNGGDSAAAGGRGAAEGNGVENDNEAMQLIERLPSCCDFEASHLMVAYDIALRARRINVALVATQLAMRDSASRRTLPSSHAAGAPLQEAVSLVNASLAARMAPAHRGRRKGAGGAASAGGSGGIDEALPRDVAHGALQDLQWLCSRLKAVGGDLAGLPSGAKVTFAWLRDVALRICHDALRSGEQVEAEATGSAAPGEDGALRGALLQLRFVAATFRLDEQRQKAVLQALIQEQSVRASHLEALAELCLTPSSPWRCAAMACGLLGFALRKALTALAAGASVQAAAETSCRAGAPALDGGAVEPDASETGVKLVARVGVIMAWRAFF
ncbi:hypothetical protein GPECTOR_1g71 [Gonium pectorale]|uniref:Uncharacterized protein n=1 Tax=Gonium pectorale TaxID=33097 RepID=A0A150H4N0_GONPE|nr:hypothetical protein GPECTOR_1g71 [Gonium pectorale]|eukprot:KXZ56788.1 hypothetical protein GPECTOR_1g71 [Gonium pectorale]